MEIETKLSLVFLLNLSIITTLIIFYEVNNFQQPQITTFSTLQQNQIILIMIGPLLIALDILVIYYIYYIIIMKEDDKNEE
jgi:hypothetical protein